jgi:hypothetical protein
MILLDLLKDLTYGEFAQLKLGNLIFDNAESEPDPRQYEGLLSSVNLGLLEIYKRFMLLSREVDVQQYEEISIYMLHSKYSQTVGTEATKYIMDTAADPFLDDVLRIEEIYDEEGNLLFMNDVTQDYSLYTPSYRTIQVPYPNNDNIMSVQYRATHPKLSYTANYDPSTVEIACPNSLHEALLYYIASRQFAGMGDTFSDKANEYYKKFENSCAMVVELGLEVQPDQADTAFERGGWV